MDSAVSAAEACKSEDEVTATLGRTQTGLNESCKAGCVPDISGAWWGLSALYSMRVA